MINQKIFFKLKENKKITYLLMIPIIFGILYTSYIQFFLTYKSNIYVHFIDVGQGKATLIQTAYGNMLIDGGDVLQGPNVMQYLRYIGVYFIDYVIATHPHADHIGGLIYVLDNLPIGSLMKPYRSHTTLTFERFLYVLQTNDIYIKYPIVNNTLHLGDVTFTIVAPNSYGYSNLNNYSIVLLMEYGKRSFLFTADVETTSEMEILYLGHNISADVLQVAHHGSSTSTTEEFLQQVSPYIAIISAGRNNQYGHPHNVVLHRLLYNNVLIYRTDYHGHIVISTDGTNLVVH